jgi:hypothetical protein
VLYPVELTIQNETHHKEGIEGVGNADYQNRTDVNWLQINYSATKLNQLFLTIFIIH